MSPDVTQKFKNKNTKERGRKKKENRMASKLSFLFVIVDLYMNLLIPYIVL